MALGPQERQNPPASPSGFVYLSPSCHVFDTSLQAMIKTYNQKFFVDIIFLFLSFVKYTQVFHIYEHI